MICCCCLPCTPGPTVHCPACSYVRRNAVLAINAIYRLPKGELLLSDAPDLVEKVLQVGHVPSPTLLGCLRVTTGLLLSDLVWWQRCSGGGEGIGRWGGPLLRGRCPGCLSDGLECQHTIPVPISAVCLTCFLSHT